jgi:hypothetical protein|tara:strand:- start:8434 stop:8619 length:186 start_codon:yes stop_codon:yes gene_type:complete
MTKKTYNCTVDSLNVEDDGKTVVLPPEAQEALGLKENEKIVMTKVAGGGKQAVFKIRSNET